jgi:hypothetical protein
VEPEELMNVNPVALPEEPDDPADSGVSSSSEERVSLAADVLRQLLIRAREGAVSTQALRKELEARSIPEPQELIAKLKSLEFSVERGHTWYHIGRSFLTESKYREARRTQEVEARQAEVADVAADDLEDSDDEQEIAVPRERKKRRREEGRLGAYIVPFLEEIYDDEASPDTYVFDVHSTRGGTDFENVDLLAMHWRSAKCVDVISVEVKLRFTGFSGSAGAQLHALLGTRVDCPSRGRDNGEGRGDGTASARSTAL